jgi:hypothetical protein
MNEHIDILLLLDYAQGKISDGPQRDPITDHLCDCESCRQILKSHYYLIHNHDVLLEKFFPQVEPVVNYETTAEASKEADFQLSVTRIIQSISDKIQALKEQGSFISQEIKIEVSRFMDEISSSSNIEVSLVPLKVENISLLGAEEAEKPKDQKLKYLSHNIKLIFLPLQHFRIEDFAYRFTGKFFYISYEKENFRELKDRKANLTTGIGAPFIFTTSFKETHRSVSARFKIEFEDLLPLEDSTTSKEIYHEFFLSIE